MWHGVAPAMGAVRGAGTFLVKEKVGAQIGLGQVVLGE